MNKTALFGIFVAALIVLVGAVYYWTTDTPEVAPTAFPTETPTPQATQASGQAAPTAVSDQITDENAELVGFNFILDFIASAPPESDESAEARAYAALSESAKRSVSEENVFSDLAEFIGVQSAPEQGASVEDLQVDTETEARLIVGLNYADGRELRQINLVAEDGVWKVDSVDPLEQYP